MNSNWYSNYKIVERLTVDDEEPDCMKCVHCTDSQEFCDKNCGAEHQWNGYLHNIYEEIKKENK